VTFWNHPGLRASRGGRRFQLQGRVGTRVRSGEARDEQYRCVGSQQSNGQPIQRARGVFQYPRTPKASGGGIGSRVQGMDTEEGPMRTGGSERAFGDPLLPGLQEETDESRTQSRARKSQQLDTRRTASFEERDSASRTPRWRK
jgi:hypothetical protein